MDAEERRNSKAEAMPDSALKKETQTSIVQGTIHLNMEKNIANGKAATAKQQKVTIRS